MRLVCGLCAPWVRLGYGLGAVWAVIVVIFVKKHYFSGGIANGWTGEKGRIGQVDSGNVTLW